MTKRANRPSNRSAKNRRRQQRKGKRPERYSVPHHEALDMYRTWLIVRGVLPPTVDDFVDKTDRFLSAMASAAPGFDPTAWRLRDIINAGVIVDTEEASSDAVGRGALDRASTPLMFWLDFCRATDLWTGREADRLAALNAFSGDLDVFERPDGWTLADEIAAAEPDPEIPGTFPEALARSPIVARFAGFLDWYAVHAGRVERERVSADTLREVAEAMGGDPDRFNERSMADDFATMHSVAVQLSPEFLDGWPGSRKLPIEVGRAAVAARVYRLIALAPDDDVLFGADSDFIQHGPDDNEDLAAILFKGLLGSSLDGVPENLADFMSQVADDDPGTGVVTTAVRRRVTAAVTDGILTEIDGVVAVVPAFMGVVGDVYEMTEPEECYYDGDDFDED